MLESSKFIFSSFLLLFHSSSSGFSSPPPVYASHLSPVPNIPMPSFSPPGIAERSFDTMENTIYHFLFNFTLFPSSITPSASVHSSSHVSVSSPSNPIHSPPNSSLSTLLPRSSLKVSIESSKGLYSLFMSAYPIYSVNVIASDFLMICCLNKFCKGINLADLIAILGSIDFVLGSVDLYPSFLYVLYFLVLKHFDLIVTYIPY
jgi:hypothetical protein